MRLTEEALWGRCAVLRGALEFIASEATDHAPTIATRDYADAVLRDDAHAEAVLRQRQARELREQTVGESIPATGEKP